MTRVSCIIGTLSLMVIKATVGQDCGAIIANYTACTLANLATCSGCNATTSGSPETSGFNCTSVTNNVCPVIKCCRACEAPAYDFYQKCLLDPLSGIVGTCNLDCSAFSYGDTNVNNTEPCLSEFGSWASCIINQGDNCTGCEAYNYTYSGTDTCDAVENYFCNQVSCCQNCQDKARAFYQCTSSANDNPYNCTFDNCLAGSPTPVTPTTPSPTVLLTPPPSATGATASPTGVPTKGGTSPPSPTSAPVLTAPTVLSPTLILSCSNATTSLTTCLAANIVACSSCAATAFNLTGTPSTCEAAKNLTSSLSTCCSNCTSEIKAFVNCSLGSDARTNCVLDGTNRTSAAASMSKWGLPVVVTSLVTVLTSATMLLV